MAGIAASVGYSYGVGWAGGVIALASSLWYIYTVVRGDTGPHIVTWLVLTILGGIGTASAVEAGASAGAITSVVFAGLQFAVLVIAVAAYLGLIGFGKNDEMEWYDRYVAVVAILVLAVWQCWQHLALPFHFLGTPAFGTAAAIIADSLAMALTAIKAYRKPASESLAAWSTDIVATALGVAAVPTITFSSAGYPAYLVAGCAGVAAAVVLGRWRVIRRSRLLPQVEVGTGA